jgi:hypothetical protein
VGLRNNKAPNLSDGKGAMASLVLVSGYDMYYEPSCCSIHEMMINLKIGLPVMKRKGAVMSKTSQS